MSAIENARRCKCGAPASDDIPNVGQSGHHDLHHFGDGCGADGIEVAHMPPDTQPLLPTRDEVAAEVAHTLVPTDPPMRIGRAIVDALIARGWVRVSGETP